MTTRAKITKPSSNTKSSPAQIGPRTDYSFFQRTFRATVHGLNPQQHRGQPAIFTLSIVNLATTCLFLGSILTGVYKAAFISGMATASLWITLGWFNFARKLSRKHLSARAEALRRMPVPASAKKLGATGLSGEAELVPTVSLSRDDLILVEQGDIIPADGEVIDGFALVDEKSLTGSREPVIRIVDQTLNSVIAGTRVRSGRLVVSLKAKPGQGLAARLERLAQAKPYGPRPRNFLLSTLNAGSIGLTLLVALSLLIAGSNLSAGLVVFSLLVALVAALSPSPTAGLLAIANLARLDQLVRLDFVPLSDNVLPRLEQVSTLLLDKDAVLIPSPQQAVDFVPAGSGNVPALAEPPRLPPYLFELIAEKGDIVQYPLTIDGSQSPVGILTGLRVAHYSLANDSLPGDTVHVHLHQGGPEAVATYLRAHGIDISPDLPTVMNDVITCGGQPLVITLDDAVLGVLHVQQQLRKGLKSRLERLRELGIQIVLVSKDAPSTLAALAAAVGADDFFVLATDTSLQSLVQQHRTAGQQTVLAGWQPHDAPAIRQAGVGIALGHCAYPVREAADIIDLDSSPVRIVDLIEAVCQWQTTRRALVALALTSDLVKFLLVGLLVLGAILPASTSQTLLALSGAANIVIAGLVFNAISLISLTPLALGWLPFWLLTSDRSQRSLAVACVACGLVASLIGMALLPPFIRGLGVGG